GVICFPPSKRGVAKVERQTVTVVARDQRRAASPERKVHRNWSLPHVRRPRGGPHQVGARDTSYPTVLQFHGGIDGDVYRRWLNALPGDTSLSLCPGSPLRSSGLAAQRSLSMSRNEAPASISKIVALCPPRVGRGCSDCMPAPFGNRCRESDDARSASTPSWISKLLRRR